MQKIKIVIVRCHDEQDEKNNYFYYQTRLSEYNKKSDDH